MFKLQEGLGLEFLPTASTAHSAGFDVRSTKKIEVFPGDTVMVPTGVFIDQEIISNSNLFGFSDFASSHYFALHIRSGLAAKGLMLANGVGVIDLDYEDEICALIHNPFGHDKQKFSINVGDRIGQLVLAYHGGRLLDDFRKESARSGGFGSTGVA
jgi:deoxyuridine 5'-triphosphate nucleotidohydrolase